MIKSKNKIIIWSILVIVFLLLKHYIPYWNIITYPVNILVTFMHEFWHAFFAVITGGHVVWIDINSDWSGVTTSSWWIRNLVVSGWYLWSAIFWNILLYIWFKKEKLSQSIIYFLVWLIIFVSIFWFDSISSTLIELILAWWLFLLARYTDYDSVILQFLGVSSIIYIIEDFNVWPSSDLAHFSLILPSFIWMYVWLIIVIVITWFNLRFIFKKK
jgi:hypothetical protein